MAIQRSPASVPMGTHNFRIEIDGVSAGFFKSVEGLSIEVDVADYQRKWGDIVLKQGFADSSQKVGPAPVTAMKAAGRLVLHGFQLDPRHSHLLQHWVNPGAPKIATPRGQIILSDPSGRPVRRYNFTNAWPAKWYVPAGKSEGIVELVVGNLIRL